MSPNDGDSNGKHSCSQSRLEELIANAKTGSDSALGKALAACGPGLLRVARRGIGPRLRGVVGASDIVQDTFVNATKAFRVFRGGQANEFWNWLRRILSNRLAEIARKGGRRRNGVPHVSLDGLSEPLNHRALADESSPSSIAGGQEFAELIRAGLARLSERDQQVLHLRFDDGLSFPQIGEKLDLSEDAARMLFTRAVERLRRELPDRIQS